MKQLILSLIIVLLPSFGWGATLYMGAGETYSNLQAAMAAMSAGDTLIIRDGTYTGTSNQITNSAHPPNSSTVWTTIKAEHDGAVTFDGEGARTMFTIGGTSRTNRHWVFEGLVWGNSSADNISLGDSTHVKLLRCGAFEAGAGSNVNNIFISSYTSYILVEGCYTWGRGRTGITAWGPSSESRPDHIIFRNNVVRIDRVTAGEPAYGYGMYSVNYGLVQNCISIDTDQTAYYLNTGQNWAGGFAVATTDYQADNITFKNILVLKSVIGGISVAGNNAANNVSFQDVVVADTTNRTDASVNAPWGVQDAINHATFWKSTQGYAGVNGYGGTTPHTLTNSIITAYTASWSGGSTVFTYQITGNYVNLYNNNGTSPTSTYTNTLSVNPIWDGSTNTSGGLKYLPRIESGSNLSSAGAAGTYVGANLSTLQGTSGALWGETGYDTDTGLSMWPFPNEDLIKTKMAAYTGGGVNGARGFAASGTQLNGTDQITLTSYIWEYLGNQMPGDIYGGSAPAVSVPIGAGTMPIGAGTMPISVQ